MVQKTIEMPKQTIKQHSNHIPLGENKRTKKSIWQRILAFLCALWLLAAIRDAAGVILVMAGLFVFPVGDPLSVVNTSFFAGIGALIPTTVIGLLTLFYLIGYFDKWEVTGRSARLKQAGAYLGIGYLLYIALDYTLFFILGI